MTDKQFIATVDGGSRPNPGYAGFGLYGYTLIPSKRPTKIKHPVKTNLNFTSKGVLTTQDTVPYETIDIVEHIGAINSPTGTNNLAELLGLKKALELTLELDVCSLYLNTDSKYVVTGFNDYLDSVVKRGWKKQTGEDIAHKEHWQEIYAYREKIREQNINISVNWVKGHSTDYGNGRAHVYASIGSNFARMQYEDKHPVFNEVAYHSVKSYKEYKDQLAVKDILLYFRELFFTSSPIEDSNFCFVSTSDDVNEQGRRNSASIFITNIGYVPDEINQIKALYRKFPRYHTVSCYAKLSKLEDRELAYLARNVGIEKLIKPVLSNGIVNLHLIEDHTPFIGEYTQDFPYISEVGRIFNSTMDNTNEATTPSIRKVEVTDLFVKDGKIAFSNQDKFVDVTDRFIDSQSEDGWLNNVVPISKLLLTVGKDIPNYLALKKIEAEITKVSTIVELRPSNNYASVYVSFETNERTLLSVNITNKFMLARK